ncbi:MAG: htpG [Rhodospirillales bacterium]|jgi:molecular chaperone HtpG|nr:htpG [Rhodospirillales bacterium]
MAGEEIKFQAEVGKILDIVINSLYSNKEIFLRELISNAADACDKLRYLALTVPELAEGGGDFKIEISTDKKAKTITVADNGIGMNHDDLIANLGTIARSGTTEFLESLSGDARKDANLIGQFGVGFYACFSVADHVDVISRKAGDDVAWHWSSEGKGAFTIEEAARPQQGTSITVHLAKDQTEYLEEARIRHIVQQYSDHISIPIMLATKDGGSQLNKGSALWTRTPKEVTEEQYQEFYHHVGHAFDKPWLTLHNKAEGKVEYTNLLFVPSMRPFDLMNPERKHGVKLYVKRVFITDDCEGLMPRWLRFVRGIVDSQDLPLNVSREVLQHNVIVGRIKSALVKRIFGELKKKAEKAPDEFTTFWENFGAVVKEGLYEDQDYRDDILAIARFKTTAGENAVSLADYVGRMKDGQDDIFFITGEDETALKASPQLEGFRARGIEVLLLTDPIDEFWIPMVGKFQDKPLRSVTAGGFDLSKVAAEEKSDDMPVPEKADEGSVAKLILAFKDALDSSVRDVRATDRLTESAVCLIAGEGDMDLHLERMLRRQGHMKVPSAARILEINPAHPVIRALAAMTDDLTKKPVLADMAHLLLDQARIIEGEALADPIGFSARLNAALTRSLAA